MQSNSLLCQSPPLAISEFVQPVTLDRSLSSALPVIVRTPQRTPLFVASVRVTCLEAVGAVLKVHPLLSEWRLTVSQLA